MVGQAIKFPHAVIELFMNGKFGIMSKYPPRNQYIQHGDDAVNYNKG